MKIIRSFLSLGVIIPPLPNNILDGQQASAGPVMANFNAIVNAVNANIIQGGQYVVPNGVGGTANAITLTPSVAIAAHTDGETFTFVPKIQNTGATTVAVSGLAPIALADAAGSSGALTGAELITSQPATIVYVASLNQYRLVTPPASLRSTWTPNLTFGGAQVGMSFSQQSGYYVKFGNFIFLTAFFALSAKGSSVGSAVVTGLPFAADQSITQSPLFTFNVQALTFTSGYVVGTIGGGNNTINVMNSTAAGGNNQLDNTNFNNNTQITITGLYAV